MSTCNKLLAAIYPYSYKLIFELMKRHKKAGVNKLCAVKGMIARPSAVKQILTYSDWAISTGGHNFMFIPTDESQLKLSALDYPNIIKNKSDLSVLSSHFMVASKIYEMLISAKEPLDIKDLKPEFGSKETKYLVSIIQELSWVNYIGDDRVTYKIEECDGNINDSDIIHSVVADSYNNEFNSFSHDITDLSLNINYPHLFPRVKEALVEITEAEGKTDFDTLYWYIKDEYQELGACFPRVTAVEAVLEYASWTGKDDNSRCYFYCKRQV